MTVIKGSEGRVWVISTDGEMAELGDVRSVEWSYDGVAGVADFPDIVSVSVALQGDLANLVRMLALSAKSARSLAAAAKRARSLAAGVDQGHGARRWRGRRHDGRWQKRDRRQKRAPAWLVARRHGW